MKKSNIARICETVMISIIGILGACGMLVGFALYPIWALSQGSSFFHAIMPMFFVGMPSLALFVAWYGSLLPQFRKENIL